MRLLIVVGTLNTGGTENQFAQLADGLARGGHEVMVASLWPGGQYWRWLDDRGTVELQALCKGKSESKLGAALQLLGACRRLRRLVCERNPDVVYSAHDLTHIVAWLALLGRRDVPVVWGVRGSQIMPHWKRIVPFYLCRWLSGSADLVIANSHAGRDYYLRHGFKGRRWEVVPNGIDSSRFFPDRAGRQAVREEWKINPDEKLVGIVGRTSPIKGHDLFLRAAALLAERDERVRFVCVGRLDQPFARRMRHLARDLGIDDRVLWAGKRRDMRDVYNALDMLALCSVAEGWPNVIGEALACRTAVVATDVGDVRRVLNDDACVVASRTPEALARVIAESVNESRPEGQKHIDNASLTVEECVARTEKSLLSVANESQL